MRKTLALRGAVIGAVALGVQPLLAANNLDPAMEKSGVAIAAVPNAEAQASGSLPVEAQSESEDAPLRRVEADRTRHQALARALLLMMTGGGSRPFPLIPK